MKEAHITQLERVLCRTENYTNSHAGFNGLLRGACVASILRQLTSEPMLLFKEKINYKLAGSDDRCIAPERVHSRQWTPCDLQPGEILVFGSYLAHKSGANTSPMDRRAIYATFNREAEGDLHDQYYEDRRKLWPATPMRQEGTDYEDGDFSMGTVLHKTWGIHSG
ncbi:hypothetical protein BO99DRAFT_437995 [Aspergillus violaceofuscus CBS 115571]|uniref:Uncharacterized protein n=1 Tax=Aspergillus violaceofuscus (strain CBS 115571) TaxID=1450538 RepID=A0A2V5GRF6_ASPV1|nr:hypothetical protein BO99DRAFT_437995 [Aspergillus violaceofuscus CBS 115571]